MLGSENSGERRENELGTSSVTTTTTTTVVIEKKGLIEEEEEKGRNEIYEGTNVISSGNRWPQEETLALLRIRSDMDVAFRDSGSKAPLWDQVSRKMAALGYDRSAKKCKEKFENIYKYHKRLKSCSYARSNGKAYRFFDQLEALDHHQISFPTSVSEQVDTAMKGTTLAVEPISSNPQHVSHIAMPLSVNFDSSPITTSTSTTSSSGSESEGVRKKKRKWADFFDRLTKSVLDKQEDLQKKFLEAIDRCERERLAREEAWKMQEMARIKREHELLMQERSISAAKDAAVLAFLQKISEQGNCLGTPGQLTENPVQEMSIVCRNEKDNGESSSSRWPKEEVEALIRVRSNMDLDYQRIGPKGPLWEDVSMAMKQIGYDRSAKRCKEKWENINKYYRRVKDSNKQRPVDSKTCPYFHLLDALYSMKTKRLDNSSDGNLRPEELLMHMVNHESERQHQEEQELVNLQQGQGELIADHKSNQNDDHNQEQEEDEDAEYDGDDYHAVPNDPLPMIVTE